MENQGVVQRFEGPQAFEELMRQMEFPVGQRPRILIEGEHLHKANMPKGGVIVRNHLLRGGRNIFHISDLLRSKSGQPLRMRFVWPPKHADPHGKDLFALEAIEVLAS